MREKLCFKGFSVEEGISRGEKLDIPALVEK